eukprot:4735619-Ditylum_brightwellii.AAC.1
MEPMVCQQCSIYFIKVDYSSVWEQLCESVLFICHEVVVIAICAIVLNLSLSGIIMNDVPPSPASFRYLFSMAYIL